MTDKLALFGGKKVRNIKMPPRHAFGKAEEAYLNKAIKYYRSIGEDPPYQGKFEEMFCKKFNKSFAISRNRMSQCRPVRYFRSM